MLLLLDRMNLRGVTAHGFRSSFRPSGGRANKFPDFIGELCLAHTVGSDVQNAYKRTTLLAKRRKLMEAWAEYCASKPATGAKVVPLREAVR